MIPVHFRFRSERKLAMKKNISFLVFGILSIALLSCESPLSDVDLDDPSVIAPVLIVTKTIENGTRHVEYIGEIYDKNLSLVTLKNGTVRIENVSMGKRSFLLGGEQYFLSGENIVKHTLGKTYIFTVVFSNGSEYTGSVKTQTKDLYDFTAPSTHNRAQNMTVSWKDADSSATMFIDMAYSFKTDTSSGAGIKRITIPDASTGTFIINSSAFQESQGTIYEADLTLVSEVEGTIDSRFSSNSGTYSQLRITRTVTFN